MENTQETITVEGEVVTIEKKVVDSFDKDELLLMIDEEIATQEKNVEDAKNNLASQKEEMERLLEKRKKVA